eukprot:scaffold18197_cov122-Isochrysis_galbana.AAC.7
MGLVGLRSLHRALGFSLPVYCALLLSLPDAHGLFNFPQPPQPPGVDDLISAVAEGVLWGRLRKAEKVDVQVDSGSPIELLGGAVRGVRIRGVGWSTPLQLSCRSLDVSVGSAAVDVSALVTKRIISLQRPATGSATIRFSARDWGSFLSHPLFTGAVAARLRQDPPVTTRAPSFDASRVSIVAGAIRFPVQWGSTNLLVEISQPPGASAALATATPAPHTPQRDATGAGEMEAAVQRREAAAAREAAAWVASFFNQLKLDLDGVRFSFRRLEVERQDLLLDLKVEVFRFPSPLVNF